MNGLPWLTILTALPLVGAVVAAALKREQASLARGLGLVTCLAVLFICVGLCVRFDDAAATPQFIERYPWIPTLGVEYFLGLDGLGLLMVLLTALVVPFALLASWKHEEHANAFTALMLFLQAGLLGTFTALNFFHWFLFWELSLVPAYFLIKLWGGPRRVAAATQFFIYTFVGSVAMLLGFLALFQATGTFDFLRLTEMAREGQLTTLVTQHLRWPGFSSPAVLQLIFWGVFLGFAVKVPLFPFHIWLPATYAEAPFSVSMVLTGVMSKMGVYGFLRLVLPLFPGQLQAALTPLLWLAVATIVFSAFAAFAQHDLKRLIAYSSINHLGYCLLGIFAAARVTGSAPEWSLEKAAVLNGVLLQMFNHGITAAALFCFVGLIEARAGTRGLNDFGGLRQAAPVFCGLMGITVFASLGLPGLNGFIGEFLIFKGAFPLTPWAAALATIGLLVTAVFFLTLLQRVFHGPLPPRWSGFADLTLGERVLVAPMIALMFIIGIYPQILLQLINPTVVRLVNP